MAFDAHENKVRDLFNRKIYHIPRNQRRYVWNKDNWQELFDDIVCVINGQISAHFLGSIVLKTDPEYNGLPCYSVIDGQQRTITLTILLSSIMYWMKRLKMDNDFNGTKPYVVAKDDKNNDIIMVNTESTGSLENIITHITNDTYEEISKKSTTAFINSWRIKQKDKIGDAYIFYIESIEKLYQEHNKDSEVILKLRNAVRDITFVNITATSEEDSYTIFEILNARGMDLEDHELLKNYIMRYIQPVANRDSAKVRWNSIENELGYSNLKKFIRHYTTHRYGTHRSKQKSSDYKIIRECNKAKDTEVLLNDIEKKANYYKIIISPIKSGEDRNCTEEEFRIFTFFKQKRQEQMRPVLLSLISLKEQELIQKETYYKTLKFLYNFYICYNIIGEENSNRLSDTINKYAELICNNNYENRIDEFADELKKRLPSRETFINSFQTVGWSHHKNIYEGEKNKDRVQIILEILERYKNNGNFCDNFTIEHIQPDSEDSSNGQIGNLIPLEESINISCKNKSFNEKIEFYNRSSFVTARNIAVKA